MRGVRGGERSVRGGGERGAGGGCMCTKGVCLWAPLGRRLVFIHNYPTKFSCKLCLNLNF